MCFFVWAVVLSICHLPANYGCSETYVYDVREIAVPIDHFNFVDNQTFKLRYLIKTAAYSNSPILFYTGNEGNIELFALNTGFMWEVGTQLNATVVFAEHRYYGKSLPFGNSSFDDTGHYGFLTVEQALADYALLINKLRGGVNRPVIAFGGSYGGMLAAWLRMKYPHLVLGALASSAPIWQFNTLTSCDVFSKIVTSIFNTSYSPNCSLNIKKTWDVLRNLSSTVSGRQKLQKIFNFCNPITSSEDLEKFLSYLEDVYGNLAMVNYPYKNDFLVPLPPYPVNKFCSYLNEYKKNEEELLKAFQQALNVYTNSSGTSLCLNYTFSYNLDLGGKAWDIQTCNELVMPMCSTEDTMYRVKNWNFSDYSDVCFKKFKTRPKENDILIRYGGKDLRSVTNIIFSNGLLDPWSGGGVLYPPNDGITVILIPEAAHHLDLRSENLNDPKSVIEARSQELYVIKHWISQYKKKY